MIFGRGGSGGVINRVTKQADWDKHREISAQVGSYGRSRSAVDIGRAINSNAAFRVTAMYEDSDSYRDGVSVERTGSIPRLHSAWASAPRPRWATSTSAMIASPTVASRLSGDGRSTPMPRRSSATRP